MTKLPCLPMLFAVVSGCLVHGLAGPAAALQFPDKNLEAALRT